MNNKIYIDIESYSDIDLKRRGAYIYAADSSTEIVCLAWHIPGITSDCQLWTPPNPLPLSLSAALVNPEYRVVAHNAQFERVMLSGPPGQKIGFPEIELDRWVCTAVKAAAAGLPRDLENAALLMGLPHQKDKQGAWVMRKVCTPHKPTKKDSWHRYTPENSPDLFDILYRYCQMDVMTMVDLDRALPDITPDEKVNYTIDQQINDHGVLVDLNTVDTIQGLTEKYINYLEDKTFKLTGLKSSQRDAILNWLGSRGVYMPDYTSASVQAALDNPHTPPEARLVLQTRQAAGKTSNAKYPALMRSASPLDNRIRGMFMFCGASTGRWASKLVQLHNLPRGRIKDIFTAIKAIQTNDLSWLVRLYDNPMDVFSSCIRPMLIPAPGHEFIIGDFSGIEAVCLGWAAQEPKYLNAHRTGIDLYKLAAVDVFNCRLDSVTKTQRQVGKMLILGLGYQMGRDRFVSECRMNGIDLDRKTLEHAHTVYRGTYTGIVSFWRAIEAAAREAVLNPGRVTRLKTCDIAFKVIDRWLYMRLPSGRKIAYFKPEIRVLQTEYGPRKQITFIGQDSKTKQFRRMATYGGMLTENAIQAIARDLLAYSLRLTIDAGLRPVIHVHDEIVTEAPIGTATPQALKQIMETLPTWAGDCPVKAEVFKSPRYIKG